MEEKRNMNNYLEIVNIKSPQEFNKQLDNYLRITNEIPNDLLFRFDEAYGYDAETTINWLINKLKIIYKRLKNNEVLIINNEEVNLDRFKELIKKRYKNVENDIIKK